MNKRFATICFACSLLSGCTTDNAPKLTGFSYLNRPQLFVCANKIEVRDRSHKKLDDAQQIVKFSLVDLVRQWGREFFHPKSQIDTLVITVNDASIAEVKLPVKCGVEGAFYIENTERYDGRLVVTCEFIGQAGQIKKRHTITVQDSVFAKEGSTVSDRRTIILGLEEKLINRITEIAEKQFGDSQ